MPLNLAPNEPRGRIFGNTSAPFDRPTLPGDNVFAMSGYRLWCPSCGKMSTFEKKHDSKCRRCRSEELVKKAEADPELELGVVVLTEEQAKRRDGSGSVRTVSGGLPGTGKSRRFGVGKHRRRVPPTF
jgi:DNA-directed RNA polymerase subunit RPC12/RpoP